MPSDASEPDARTAAKRDDGFCETSINWEDDELALETLYQNRGQSQHGVARLEHVKILALAKEPGCLGGVGAERRKIPGNDYHGNILFKAQAPKLAIKMWSQSLALRATLAPRRAPKGRVKLT